MAYIVKHILKSGTKYYVQYKKDKKTFTYGKYPTKKLAEKAKLQLEVDIAEESLSKIQSIKVSEL
jgi:septal ring-binding cell division protein DamX